MLSSAEINAAGFGVLEARLRELGFASVERRSRPTRQLVVRLDDGNSVSIEVKAKSRPMQGGGDGKLAIDWWLKDQSNADLVAAVELKSERTWLFRADEFRELAQQHTPTNEWHLYMWVDPSVKPRNGYARNLDSDFEDFLLEHRVGLLGPASRNSGGSGSWSAEELAAAVRAYSIMRQHEQERVPYSKAEWNQRLRNGSLAGRTKSSVEYRMQNISAVLDALGLEWIPGYAPAGNVGSNVGRAIQSELAANGLFLGTALEATSDRLELDRRVQTLLERVDLPDPPGTAEPKMRLVRGAEYDRDPHVRAWVLQRADGKCELCGEFGPFLDREGRHFLEVHHVHPLRQGGADQVENAVALCPNCHRRLHHGADAAQKTDEVYAKVDRLKRL